MWNKNKSIILSKICIFCFAIIAAILAIIAPRFINGVVLRRGYELAWGTKRFLLSLYSLLIPAYIALFNLYILLNNIHSGNVFINDNVRILRRLSYTAFFAGIICLISTSYYLPFILLSAASAFMGLILRIIKNVFEEAICIKEENDFTI